MSIVDQIPVIVGSLPAVAGAVKVASVWLDGGRLLARRIERLRSMAEQISDDATKQRVVSVADELTEHFAKRERYRMRRTVNGATVFWIVVVAGGAAWGAWALISIGTWWGWILGIAAALFGALWIVAGSSTVFKDPDAPDKAKKPKKVRA
ncbi:hypothetical protein [Myceligenerans pegani]|uniref:Uncharacterized protein n=1 Tax=Myceligenerans pegani TaxID=2776917 RepID=A0ABR9MZU0_9MICO|nr:hypothetical protein [Myceligenerans sp. TRM 65318]MBE1876914.1 hypothetical protein [Myceligenerans sp. TRM 65318]MBE3019185.1 hypothetical protein [Myceligenerans sp. TRM 65318]